MDYKHHQHKIRSSKQPHKIRTTLQAAGRYWLLTAVFLIISSLNYADKYAGEIFRIGAGVRNFALGNTGVTDYHSTSLAYWNSSLLAKEGTPRFELMHAEEFMGEVNYDIFSAVWGSDHRYSVVISRIGITGIPLTRLPNPDEPVSPDNQPYKYKSVNNADYIAYFGLARKFDNFVLGITPKVAYRYLAESHGFGFGADISTFFEFQEHIMLGLNLRDAFTTQILWDTGTHEIVRPGVDAEIKISVPNVLAGERANIYLRNEILTEGREEAATHSLGILSFDYHIGLEIPLPEYVTLYTGYDIDNFTTGISLNIAQFQVNYAFKHNTELDNSHRVSLGFHP